MAPEGTAFSSDRPAIHPPDHQQKEADNRCNYQQQNCWTQRPPTDSMPVASFTKNNPGTLGELQQNQQESAPRKSRDYLSKPSWANICLRPTADRDAAPAQTKSKKTNLAGLLTRPKSFKNLYKQAKEDEGRPKDKENRSPPETPIFAQFTASVDVVTERQSLDVRAGSKERPKSLQVPKAAPLAASRPGSQTDKSAGVLRAFAGLTQARSKGGEVPDKMLSAGEINKQLENLLDRRNIPENQRYKMRNLNDTIKMEFIRQDWAEMQAANSTATMQSGSNSSGNSRSAMTAATPAGSDYDDDGRSQTGAAATKQTKRSRGRSFTFSRSGKKDGRSTSKKARSDMMTLGRHFRSKSADGGVATEERPTSSHSSSGGSGLLAKMKLHQGPGDYVAYLRKVQKPEAVEVGKLHKLRLLLRNETVAWIEDFMQQGGMKEIVGLLNRIMEVEWREEHEDALLHENLLCLKALSTTARAMEYLDTVQTDLLPKLLHLLFDPEKKGPSEFTTRNIITSVLLTYIESAPPAERVTRSQTVLAHLRDKQPREEERPVPFVLEMRQERPYQTWCKEVVSVTKEVFWIFLHNLNVVALPSPSTTTQQEESKESMERKNGSTKLQNSSKERKNGPLELKDGSKEGKNGSMELKNGSKDGKNRSMEDKNSSMESQDALDAAAYSYMRRHFPPERPPVPAAPYVGGVEWDATNYLASHLDVLNAILACTPTVARRNALREQLRMSGWERCLGGTLRLCKEKFYGAVHAALRTWVAAAAEDGWDVGAVRFGPPAVRKEGQGKAKKEGKKVEAPRLELGLEKQDKQDAWL